MFDQKGVLWIFGGDRLQILHYNSSCKKKKKKKQKEKKKKNKIKFYKTSFDFHDEIKGPN